MEDKIKILKENGSYRKREETEECYNLGDLDINIQIHNIEKDLEEIGCDEVD
jgi:hypothetical protein